MFIIKCDNCKREIKDKAVFANIGRSCLSSQAFCLKCANPVVNFINKLKNNKKETSGKQERKK